MSAFVVGLLTGVLSGCGIGGGSLLLLWLTLVQDMPQFTAGGINLLYFLACAPAALVSHLKNHLIDRGAVKFCVPFGAMTSLRLVCRRRDGHLPAPAAVRRAAALYRRKRIVYKTEKSGNRPEAFLV